MKSITMPKCNEDINNTNESNKDQNEFEVLFTDKKDEFINDVGTTKTELISFLYNREIGEFITPIDFLIEFVDDCCIIDDYTTLIENKCEAYCVKVIDEALKEAYESGKVKKIEWDFEKHSGILHIEALF